MSLKPVGLFEKLFSRLTENKKRVVGRCTLFRSEPFDRYTRGYCADRTENGEEPDLGTGATTGRKGQ